MRDILMVVYVVSAALALGRGACVLHGLIQADRRAREGTFYLPTATLGRAVQLLLIAPLVPVVNTWLAFLHVLRLFGLSWDAIERVLRIPLVQPAKKKSHGSP